MQVEIDKKIKFMDAWVHEDFRRKGIFTSLWDKRWEYVKKHYKGYIAYAWCLPMSLGLLRKKGFVQSINVKGKHYKYYKAMPLNFNTMDRNLVNKLTS